MYLYCSHNTDVPWFGGLHTSHLQGPKGQRGMKGDRGLKGDKVSLASYSKQLIIRNHTVLPWKPRQPSETLKLQFVSTSWCHIFFILMKIIEM